MKYTNLSTRISLNDKREFEKFCENTGMNMSVAVNLFIKTVIRENKIPFSIVSDSFYSESNMNILNESIKQLERGEVVIKTMNELTAMENE